MREVEQQLDALVERYLARWPQLYEPYDPDWRSPCEIGPPEQQAGGEALVPWRPLPRTLADDFAGLERALELEIHPDIKAYFGRYWSGGLEMTAPEGHVSLIQLWNPQDVERLIENLIGHALAKRQAGVGYSVFFACTEPNSDLFLSVENDTGAVLLEKPGYKPVRQVSDSLAAFLGELEPAQPVFLPDSER